MTSAPAPPTPSVGLVARCPLHGNPLVDWDGTTGSCRHDGRRRAHTVTEPTWGSPTPDGHLRGGPGKGFPTGQWAGRGRGYPSEQGPPRRITFRADQEQFAEGMAAAHDSTRTAALQELCHLGLEALDAGDALPDDRGRESVTGQPVRAMRFRAADDTRVEAMRGSGRMSRSALHRRILDAGINASRRR